MFFCLIFNVWKASFCSTLSKSEMSETKQHSLFLHFSKLMSFNFYHYFYHYYYSFCLVFSIVSADRLLFTHSIHSILPLTCAFHLHDSIIWIAVCREYWQSSKDQSALGKKKNPRYKRRNNWVDQCSTVSTKHFVHFRGREKSGICSLSLNASDGFFLSTKMALNRCVWRLFVMYMCELYKKCFVRHIFSHFLSISCVLPFAVFDLFSTLL